MTRWYRWQKNQHQRWTMNQNQDYLVWIQKNTDKGGKKGSSGGKRKDDDDGDDDGDPTTRKKKAGKYQAEEKILNEELGSDVTICPRCILDQKTHTRLITNVRKFHEDVFNFLCKECDRGFITRNGWKIHMKSHNKQANRLKCPKGCEKDFVDKKVLLVT